MTAQFLDLIATLATSTPGSVLAKVTLALAAGLIATACVRRARASVRHAMLTATLAVALVLPVGVLLLPAVAIEIPMVDVAPQPAPIRVPQLAFPAAQSPLPLLPAGQAAFEVSVPVVIGVAWIAGATGLLLSLAFAVWRLHRIRRSSLPWPEATPIVKELALRAGITQSVDVLIHEAISTPLTYGILRPAIVVSSDTRDWDDAALRRALVHELEHIRRRDWWIHLAARLTCAVYWFHPLVWMAYRQLALEAERACDDAVVACEESTQYAQQLVRLAQHMGVARQPLLSMANRSDLSTRVTALLDAQQRRGRTGSARAALVTLVAALALLSLAPVRMMAITTASGTIGEGQRRDRGSRIDRALVEAAADGDTEDVNRLLASGANLDAAVDGDGSPLIAAARGGHLALVAMLLDRGADPNLGVHGDGNPLIMAAREGHLSIVSLLLDRGARIEDIVDGDENALIQASGAGALDVVKLLVARGANVNARVYVEEPYRGASEWRTPLSMARRGEHRAVVEFLLSKGAREN